MHTRSGSDAKDILESDIGEELLIEQLRVVVRGNNQPSPDAVTAYYQANPGRFTLPERVRVSVILLKVPPYAAASEWQARMKEAQSLRQRIIEGGDFAVIARERSEHESATQGGSLGLVHSGMLTQELQQIVDKLQVGELAEASAILQGIVLLRLDERQPSALMPLERARERARRLLEDEEGERAWQALVVQLRETVPVKLLQEAP
jgi:parvulin-like peptidyl-prolyl isomerase